MYVKVEFRDPLDRGPQQRISVGSGTLLALPCLIPALGRGTPGFCSVDPSGQHHHRPGGRNPYPECPIFCTVHSFPHPYPGGKGVPCLMTWVENRVEGRFFGRTLHGVGGLRYQDYLRLEMPGIDCNWACSFGRPKGPRRAPSGGTYPRSRPTRHYHGLLCAWVPTGQARTWNISSMFLITDIPFSFLGAT